MEWKIGEIKQVNGEWYQCIKGLGCNECDLSKITCYHRFESGSCSPNMRKDGTQVIFKKLEKVGELFTIVGTLCQHYRVFDIDNVCGDGFWCVHNYKARTLTIEIKQNKEDMEEKKIQHYDCFFDKKKSNLKPFDIQKAKEGKPVCTRDGRKARIICFDAKSHYPIIALVETFVKEYNSVREDSYYYTIDGRAINIEHESKDDLMMLPEKKEGYVNIVKEAYSDDKVVLGHIFGSYEDAVRSGKVNERYIATVKIQWEE